MTTDAPQRLRSLDVFRGADIAAMIFVNMTWDRSVFHPQLFHVGWNDGKMGATFTDLVFPWFLFIAGCAIPFSINSGRGKGRTEGSMILTAARRALVIYTLGTLLSAAASGQLKLLTLDILQFIAIAYFFGVLLWLSGNAARIAFIVVVLLAKWWLMTGFTHPVAGDNVWTLDQNGRQWVSQWLAGIDKHIASWLDGTLYAPIHANTFGNFFGWLSGLINILPGTAVLVLGSIVGDQLRRADDHRARIALRLIIAGVVATGVSYVWQLHMPYSKDFFTSSYALLAAGTGTIILGALYYVIDARPADPSNLQPPLRWVVFVFTVFGVNAIALYVGNEALFRLILRNWTIIGPTGQAESIAGGTQSFLKAWFGKSGGLWLWVTLYMVIWWLVMHQLYRRRIFIKV